MPVNTLAEVINLFNPRHSLKDDELDKYYVARPHAPLEPLKNYLEVTDEPVKILFSGHRGSGKSTELRRLAKDVADRFFIVHVSASETLNVADMNYVDVALACAAALFREASNRARNVKIPATLWKDVLDLLTNEITNETTIKVPKTGVLSAKVNALIFKLEGKYGKETETRKVMREKLFPYVNDLLMQANQVCARIEQLTKRPPLIIFEDLDKPDLETARDMFFNHATTLNSMACRIIIYTVPIALYYSREFRSRVGDYGRQFLLPNVSLYHRDGTPNPQGRDALHAVVTRRVVEDLIEPGALRLIVELSGGLLRDLIRIVRDAALIARTEKSSVITAEMVQRVGAEITNEYIRTLNRKHYEALRAARDTKMIVSEDDDDETLLQVLENLSLLEYSNDTTWCDVHPVVRGLL